MDRIDSQILLRLQENARISNVELAAAVGLSPSACLRRVNLLEQSGVIDSYNASLNAAKLGHEVLVLMQITLEGQSAEMLAEFEAVNVDSYFVLGGRLQEVGWRTLSPRHLHAVVDDMVQKRLGV